MSDLVAAFPNIQFPFFIVAPSDRRAAVSAEITRPTFARLHPPLAKACGFITYERLRELVQQLSPDTVAYMNPEVIRTKAEYFT
jgi:hypothetical protein